MSPKHPRLPLLAAVVLGGVALAGCAGSAAGPTSAPATTTPSVAERAPYQGHAAAGSAAGAPATGAGAQSLGLVVSPAAPLVVRTGSVTLSVAKKRLVSVFDRVSAAAVALGGFVATSSSNLSGGPLGSALTLRVPSDEFGPLVTRVDSFGKVQMQQEAGRDVTGAVVNLAARITNLKSEEGALRTLLSHAGTIPAILQVQDQLFGVEGEIEQLAGQQNSLVNRATYATLTVQLVPVTAAPVKAKHAKENAFVRAVKLALHNSWVAARAVLLAVGWAFPAVALALLGVGGWRLRRRITSSRRDVAGTTPSA
jgi:hypothetical protein